MRSAAGTSDVWNWQPCSNEAGHPIVRIGQVVEKVESNTVVKFPRNKIGFDLPKIVVDLMSSLIL